MIRALNEFPGITWRAGSSPRFHNKPLGWSKSLCGLKSGAAEDLEQAVRRGVAHEVTLTGLLPSHFDAAERWPVCAKVINDIRDQSNCGCCWAFGPASAASDRLCIATDGAMQVPLSAQELCFCARDEGCGGGFARTSWKYILEHGLVTGGQQVVNGSRNPDAFAEQRFCSKFSLPHCHHHGPQREDPFAPEGDDACPEVRPSESPSCPQSCDADADQLHGSFWQDRYRLDGGVVAVHRDASTMALSLVRDGPLSSALEVHEDFENYVGGIYQHTFGRFVGGHVVRVVGFGVDSRGLKYWRVANSWNPYWGEDGYFRIVRGSDHCKFESAALAGVGGEWSLAGSKTRSDRARSFLQALKVI